MTPDRIAEEFERARYEQLRGHHWAELREAERLTRIEVARAAMDQSGITADIEALNARAAASDELAERLARREAELGRSITDHAAQVAVLEQTITAQRAELEGEIAAQRAEHEAEVERLRTSALEAHRDRRRAEVRADVAEAVVAGVRAALETVPPAMTDAVDALPGETAAPEAQGGRGLFGKRPARSQH